MARTRNSATTARIRRSRPVSARTAARRARKTEAEKAEKLANRGKRTQAPETLGQALVWQRKRWRYEIAGLCDRDAAAAAWGHALGFQKIADPCTQCQPLIAKFPNPGPRGSKWRKILDKLEYMSEDELGKWLDEHDPDEGSA